MSISELIQIRCKNNKKNENVEMGSTLFDIFPKLNLKMVHGPLSAKVNNKVEGMHYRVYRNKEVEFLDITSPSGMRTYTRTLFFVLCKAVHDLFKSSLVVIEFPVSNGYYCNVQLGRPLLAEDAAKIKQRMQEIIDSKMPIRRFEQPTEDVIALFKEKGDEAKVKLLQSTGMLYSVYYAIDDYVDYYYGSLLTNTSQLYLFGLEFYENGLLLRVPSSSNPEVLGSMVQQDKMFEMFREHHRWQGLLGVRTVGDFNEKVEEGQGSDLIRVSEALQEKRIAKIADDIAQRTNIKVVLIAGPSSSGKTTFCKRLSIQLLTNGIHPVQLSLDNYFVDRDKTPKQPNGDYDYEHLHAIDIDLLNKQLKMLLNGERVELPRYNFVTGKSEKETGDFVQLNPDNVLLIEGIHALNPDLTAQLPGDSLFKVYISALTTILLDDHNYIPTTDNRLLRRIIRDYKYRNASAENTIDRWQSVRDGEEKWIFPYQEEADVMFNTAMLFEFAVIRSQAEPLLERVPQNCSAYSEALRLLGFLKYVTPIHDNEIPPTSLLREFLGGSSFLY